MDILDPLGTTSVPPRRLAPRPETLGGLTIGLLDNSKPNARVLLERVGSALVQRMGARGVRIWHKPGASAGAAPGLLDEIAAGSGVVLTASAD